jgi:hypothetical protein
VDESHRREVERQITGPGQFASVSDFWLLVKVEDLRDDETGALDPEKVTAARDRVLRDHPHWRDGRRRSFDGGVRREQPSAPSFGKTLKGHPARR